MQLAGSVAGSLPPALGAAFAAVLQIELEAPELPMPKMAGGLKASTRAP